VEPLQLAYSNLYQNPFQIHQLILSSYTDDWRWYFRYLGDQFAREVWLQDFSNIQQDVLTLAQNNRAMVIKPEEAHANSSFQRVKALRNINDFAHFAKACCSSNLDLVTKLHESRLPAFVLASNELDSYITSLRGNIESSKALIPRIRNTIDLVSMVTST
jgi:hypothetical protein